MPGKKSAAKPKYARIVETLTDLIHQGALRPGDRLPSDEQLVERYEASRNTVVRALSDLRDAGLVERIQGAGTFVSKDVPTDTLRCLFIGDGHFDPQSRDSVFGRLEMAIDRLLRTRRHAVLELDRPLADGLIEHKERAVSYAVQQRLDGVFYLPLEARENAAERNEQWLEQLRQAGVAVVLLDQDHQIGAGRSSFDLVCLDHEAAGLHVGQHLREVGAERVLFLGPQIFPSTVEQRLRGMTRAVDGSVEFEVLHAGDDQAAISEAIRTFKPDAVVGKDDRLAATAMRVLYQDHLRVPDQVMVCGFDNAAIATDLPVMLSSYGQPIDEIADAALYLMTSRLERPTCATRKVVVCGKMIVRASTTRRP
jgi:DNA-binding LacI/PurR family transcriptional regulator/DNA-binding transcriptional regulator YhcF (GntR family)